MNLGIGMNQDSGELEKRREILAYQTYHTYAENWVCLLSICRTASWEALLQQLKRSATVGLTNPFH